MKTFKAHYGMANTNTDVTQETRDYAIMLLNQYGYKAGEYNPRDVGAYAFANEFGPFAIGIGDNEQEAIDDAVDENRFDCQKMSDEDYAEYESKGWDDSYMLAGNASEPFWTTYLHMERII